MKKGACSNCGKTARVVRGTYAFTESGLRNVVLHGIEMSKCRSCGNVEPVIPRMNDLFHALALAVVQQPHRLAGDDIRFLRKYLHMTGDQFSRLLHVDRATLSKWENDDDRIGPQSDLLIRAVALMLGEGLQDRAGEFVRDFQRIEPKRKSHLRLNLNVKTLEFEYA